MGIDVDRSTSAQVDLSQSRVLIRLDLNVPLSKDDGVTITDDTRLRAVVPTMNFLKEQGAYFTEKSVGARRGCCASPAGRLLSGALFSNESAPGCQMGQQKQMFFDHAIFNVS